MGFLSKCESSLGLARAHTHVLAKRFLLSAACMKKENIATVHDGLIAILKHLARSHSTNLYWSGSHHIEPPFRFTSKGKSIAHIALEAVDIAYVAEEPDDGK
eukprot:gnl/TRDRNA2_/TRDRNA2_177110_c0_seq2.p1 gnl/TRDRNA2_/TRDRNA2_177110_c0~~gnl/TRDRNA2_/TRDRNA2_177110_c0_seq2.p1  ORF type:complete len:102 (-),score=13.01 gnl/TRDRNA2_/TRDRNA2_177110_c0_seq2:35-340(-)